ncbi:MAG TPA: phenylalanine--tRNA ligase subunit beta [Candidatus Dormibacteraeota bacterium]
MPLRISMDWLREYIELPESAGDLADRLTLSGTEVERVVQLGTGWDGVLVARVLEVAAIPGADLVRRAVLEVGDRTVEVVSGAPNLRQGDLLAWAQPGTTLPNGMEIGERRFKGVTSQGMATSPVELGISSEADGLLVLGTEGSTGMPLSELMPPDEVMVIEVTTNRPDLLCHLGIARELSALLRRPLRAPAPRPAESAAPSPLTVEILAPERCTRYQARHLAGVTVGPSPAWLQRRLRAVGQKPISNVVDAANYVMFECGQPLHAFDASRLDRGIIVRRAQAGEEISTLDGRTRSLITDDLVIADHTVAVAIAGVIGGADSAVSAATSSILLESASFSGVGVRNTSRRLALRTDASTRFEKQLSPDLTAPAIDRLAELVQQVAGAGPSSPALDVHPGKAAPGVITVSRGFVGTLLGADVEDAEVTRTLVALGFEVSSNRDGGLVVTQPPFRRDVHAAVDLVEEVGRLRGYNSLPSTLPGRRLQVQSILPPPDPEWRARDIAMGAGHDEVINSSFCGPGDPDIGIFPTARLALSNPMSGEQAQLRTSALWGLARTVRRNVAWGNTGVAIFEIGHVFWPRDGLDLPDEPRSLAVAVHLPPGRAASDDGVRSALLALKGLLETVAEEVCGLSLGHRQGEVPGLHPGRAARVSLEGRDMGCLGQLHPELLRALDVPGGIVVAEIDFEPLAAHPRQIGYRPPSRFPPVPRDLSISVPELTPARDVFEAISGAGEVILRTVELFDEYRGSQVEAGRKGLAFRLVFQSDDRTLTGDEVAAAEARIAGLVRERFSATRRD